MENLCELTFDSMLFQNIDDCHYFLCLSGSLAIGKFQKKNRQIVLPERSYFLVSSEHYDKWSEFLILCANVILGDTVMAAGHSAVIQDSNGLKVFYSFEKEGVITLKTNQEDCITLTITRNVVIPLLEGFSNLCLTPLCGSSFVAFKIGVFVDFCGKNWLHGKENVLLSCLQNDQELWIKLEKLYPNESEAVISDLGCFIKSRKKQIEAAMTVQMQLEAALEYFKKTA
jgi:hypothetical protein